MRVGDGDGVRWSIAARVLALGSGDRGLFHVDVVSIFDISFMVEACLLVEFGKFTLAFF